MNSTSLARRAARFALLRVGTLPAPQAQQLQDLCDSLAMGASQHVGSITSEITELRWLVQQGWMSWPCAVGLPAGAPRSVVAKKRGGRGTKPAALLALDRSRTGLLRNLLDIACARATLLANPCSCAAHPQCWPGPQVVEAIVAWHCSVMAQRVVCRSDVGGHFLQAQVALYMVQKLISTFVRYLL